MNKPESFGETPLDPNFAVAKLMFDGGDAHIPAELRSQADLSAGGPVETILADMNLALQTAVALGGTSLTAIRKPDEKPFVLKLGRDSERRSGDFSWA